MARIKNARFARGKQQKQNERTIVHTESPSVSLCIITARVIKARFARRNGNTANPRALRPSNPEMDALHRTPTTQPGNGRLTPHSDHTARKWTPYTALLRSSGGLCTAPRAGVYTTKCQRQTQRGRAITNNYKRTTSKRLSNEIADRERKRREDAEEALSAVIACHNSDPILIAREPGYRWHDVIKQAIAHFTHYKD